MLLLVATEVEVELLMVAAAALLSAEELVE